MGSQGYSQVLVSGVGCWMSRGIIVPSLLFAVALVVSPVRCILEDEKTKCTTLVADLAKETPQW